MIIRMVDNISLPRVLPCGKGARKQTSTRCKSFRSDIGGGDRFLAASTFGQRRASAVQPSARRLIDKLRKLIAHVRVVGVEPGDLLGSHQGRLDQTAVDRRQRQGLETVQRL